LALAGDVSLLRGGATSPAPALTVQHVPVFLGKIVAVDAVRLGRIFGRDSTGTQYIFPISNLFQVMRVGAAPIPAKMIQ
jgi:hypothetical protein